MKKRKKVFSLEPVRSCGKCTACCTVLRVDDLEKPAGVPCMHLCQSGCAIHDQPRPFVCGDFKCLWLEGCLSKGNETALRPDNIGLMFVPHDDGVIAFEVREGAAKEPAAKSVLDRLAAKMVCLVMPYDQTQRRVAMGPDHLLREVARKIGLAG